jgi:hypothetical protein
LQFARCEDAQEESAGNEEQGVAGDMCTLFSLQKFDDNGGDDAQDA